MTRIMVAGDVSSDVRDFMVKHIENTTIWLLFCNKTGDVEPLQNVLA